MLIDDNEVSCHGTENVAEFVLTNLKKQLCARFMGNYISKLL